MLYLQGVLPQHSPSSDFGENQLSRGLISLSLLLSSHLRIFQHSRVRSSIWCYPNFNLLKSRSPPLRVYCPRLIAHSALGFPSLPFQRNLGSPRTITRRLIMQKAGRHPLNLRFMILDLRFSTSALGASRRRVNRKSQIANSGGSDTLYAFGCRSISLP